MVRQRTMHVRSVPVPVPGISGFDAAGRQASKTPRGATTSPGSAWECPLHSANPASGHVAHVPPSSPAPDQRQAAGVPGGSCRFQPGPALPSSRTTNRVDQVAGGVGLAVRRGQTISPRSHLQSAELHGKGKRAVAADCLGSSGSYGRTVTGRARLILSPRFSRCFVDRLGL